jgi:hydroxypyruvate reductase
MIRDRDHERESAATRVALDCLEAGIESAHPDSVVPEAVSVTGTTLTVAGETFDLRAYDSVVVFGGGNAAGHVAAALEPVLDDELDGGVVVTDDPAETECVEVLPADHPLPSERGVESTRALLDRAGEVDERTLVLGVITGGGSACMVAPRGVPLSDLRATTTALLDGGIPIEDVNAVRKHLSAVKGGQLARELAPARVCGIVFSDVVGDDLSVIASGPLVPDRSTYEDALAVLDGTDAEIPARVRAHLQRGAAGEIPETPRAGDSAFDRVTTHVVASNMTALQAASERASAAGYEPLVLTSRLQGEARTAAGTHTAIAAEIRATGTPLAPPAVLLSGGETTVTVTGDGQGGPNQEFVLGGATALPSGSVLAAVDTDGIDGETDAAGAIVEAGELTDSEAVESALAASDAYGLLSGADALIETGPTGTNVNDLRLLVVE